MGKILYLILVLQIGLFASDKLNVGYRPFSRCIYYYGCSSHKRDGLNSKVVIAKRDTSVKQKSDEYASLYQTVRSYINTPTSDASGGSHRYTKSGIKGFWEFTFTFQKIFVPLFLERMFEEFVVFPYFDNRTDLRIGEEIKVDIASPIAFSKSREVNKKKHVDLLQTVEGVENMLGYKCLKINYQMRDSLRYKGDYLHLKLKGTVYFAIEEGIVVVDISEAEQDMLNDDYEIEKLFYQKKMRLVSYEP